MMTRKPQLVVFSPKSINSEFYRTNFCRLSVLNEVKGEYETVFLTFRKDTDKAIKQIYEASGFKFDRCISYASHLEEHFAIGKPKKYASWREYLEQVDLFTSQLGNVEQLIIAGNPLSTGSGINRKKNVLGSMLDTQKFMGFASTCNYMVGMMQMINLAKSTGCKIHNLIRDPLENALSHTDYLPAAKMEDYHDYDSPSYGFHRFDGYQHYLIHNEPAKLFPTDKTIDFTFGFSVITKEREKVYENFVQGVDIKNNKNQIFIRNKFENIDTFIDRDPYLNIIEQSRFTLQVPSYDDQHFSTARFVESLHRDCLPFISSDTVTNEFAPSFGIESELLAELVVDYSEIQDKIENTSETKRLELLNTLQQKVLNYERGLLL